MLTENKFKDISKVSLEEILQRTIQAARARGGKECLDIKIYYNDDDVKVNALKVCQTIPLTRKKLFYNYQVLMFLLNDETTV